MEILQPKDSEILNWDPENMDEYWSQCSSFDSRANDTQSIMGGLSNQIDSERAFEAMFNRLQKRLD